MILYTIGFTQKTAKQFFELIKVNNIRLLIDIRLNNTSQLAGFTKGKDLEYFLSEICRCAYLHDINYAPTKEILDGYKKNRITWDNYEQQYADLIKQREPYKGFYNMYLDYDNICLLCSEATPTNCHRRLLAEIIKKEFPQIVIKHI